MIKISGFSYIRNGFDYDVPFLESIQSILPICDEFVIAVGDSSDGTREAIEALNSPKLKIIDTVWDNKMKKNGKIFAQQTNIALDNISGNWAFHLQADEVIHENDLPLLLEFIRENDDVHEVDGMLFPFIHFWGGYNYYRTSRRVHRFEIRVFKNNKCIRSYRDSQGFRIYSGKDTYEQGKEKGVKLKVKKIDIPVYHYNVRSPSSMVNKIQKMALCYNDGKIVNVENADTILQKIDRLEMFQGRHPNVMQQKVDSQDWQFTFDPTKPVWHKPKDRFMQPIEDFLGYRFGEYKNYRLIR